MQVHVSNYNDYNPPYHAIRWFDSDEDLETHYKALKRWINDNNLSKDIRLFYTRRDGQFIMIKAEIQNDELFAFFKLQWA